MRMLLSIDMSTVPVIVQKPFSCRRMSSSVLEHFKRESACCDHPTQQIPVDIRGIGCRSREDPFPDRESFQRFFLIQCHCQKPAQEPDLPFRVQIVNNVGKHEPHKLNATSRFVGMESLYLEARSAAWLRELSALHFPLSVTNHHGSKVSVVCQNRQHILTRDRVGHGFDPCSFDLQPVPSHRATEFRSHCNDKPPPLFLLSPCGRKFSEDLAKSHPSSASQAKSGD